jgi:hypothetical protein
MRHGRVRQDKMQDSYFDIWICDLHTNMYNIASSGAYHVCPSITLHVELAAIVALRDS